MKKRHESFRLQIRGVPWRMVRGPLANVKDREGNSHRGTDLDGYCNFNAKTVHISDKPEEGTIAAIVHEVTHACHPDLIEEAVTETEKALITALVKACEKGWIK